MSQGSIEEALRMPDEWGAEFIRGEIVRKASPSPEHSRLQFLLGGWLSRYFDRSVLRNRPGGWWFAPECDIRLGDELFRPDLCGWRVEALPVLPKVRPVLVRPDWICEILSVSNARRDRREKRESYWRAAVPHYWLADPVEQTIEVMRREANGYTVVQVGVPGELLRGEPFDSVELDVGFVFDVEPAPLTLHDSNR